MILHRLLSPLKRYFSDSDAIILSTVIFSTLILFYLFGHLLAPVFIAVVIAYLLQWPVGFLERYHVPHVVAVLAVFIVFLTCLVMALLGLIPLLWRQFSLLIDGLPELFAHGQAFLNTLPEKYPAYISITQVQNLMGYARVEIVHIGQALLSYVISSVPGIFIMGVYLVMVPLLVYFFLMDREELLDLVSYYMPAKRSYLSRLWKEIYEQIGSYVNGRVLEIIVVSIACYILFAFFSLPYTILLAVMVGISVIIPFIGTLVATIPVVILAALQWGPSWQLSYLLGIYVLIHVVDTNILIPVLFSRVIKLHPIAIIVALLVFGGLLGFWGVFFAIPLAAVIKTIVNNWPVE